MMTDDRGVVDGKGLYLTFEEGSVSRRRLDTIDRIALDWSATSTLIGWDGVTLPNNYADVFHLPAMFLFPTGRCVCGTRPVQQSTPLVLLHTPSDLHHCIAHYEVFTLSAALAAKTGMMTRIAVTFVAALGLASSAGFGNGTLRCMSRRGDRNGGTGGFFFGRPIAAGGALKPVDAALLARGGDVKPPPALYANAVELGTKKAGTSAQDTWMLGVISGCHIAFGGLLAITIGGALPQMKSSNPGLQKLIFGLFGLPFGLFMVLCAGGELFTGNTALVTAAVIEGRASFKQLIKNWSLSYFGNLVGSLFLANLIVGAGLNSSPQAAAAIAVSKVAGSFTQTFLKGIVCNWMVCMAVWLAAGSSTLTEKYLAMILPISAFVAFGAEHSVANMFLLPLGLLSGASDSVSWADVAVKNILPVTLGNIVGGAVCQAGLYSAVYGTLLK